MSTTHSTHAQAIGVLRTEMAREARRWQLATMSYGFTYYAGRITLIVASAVVAAEQTLGTGNGAWLAAWVPLLALFVAVVTALETWLKPLEKWRGFMESRDLLADLGIQVQAGLPLDEARAAFLDLRKRHREKNVF